MGGLHNSMRRLAVDGVPVVTGLAAVGDSVCTTNPTFGRGLALACKARRISQSCSMSTARMRWD
jgi:flavin-dependent dehydrogenase